MMRHDSHSLSQVLARYPHEVQPVRSVQRLGGAGGHSGAWLWRYEAPAGWILARAWPVNVQNPERVLTIHRWLLDASDLGFLPTPIPARDGQTVQSCEGRLWELTPWLEGETERGRPPDARRVQTAFLALARFHRRLAGRATMGGSPGLARCIAELESLAARDFRLLETALHREPEGELRTSGFRWLALVQPLAPRVLAEIREAACLCVPLLPCLRDARP
jgi:hypothetical protein